MKFLDALKAGVREYARVRGLYLQERRKQAVQRYDDSHNADGTKKAIPAKAAE